MEKDKIKELKKELCTLLDKYDVSIGFTCSEMSDPQGLYEEQIVIQTNKDNINIIQTDSWWLCKEDLRDDSE